MTVYAIASGKGGVGKTTTAVALAACAAAADRSVVVVDADLGMADVATFLDLPADAPTLHDVLAGEADVEAALRTDGDFDVLPAGTDLEGYAAADPEGLEAVVAELRDRYDVVILDVGAGLSHDTVLPLGLADEVVLVSTADEVSVLDTDKTREMAERVGGRLRGVVLTKVVDADLEAVSASIDVPLLGVVPQDDVVLEATAAGEPVPAYAPDSPAGTAYMDVAADLFEVAVTAIQFGEEESVDASAVPFADDDDPLAAAGDPDPAPDPDGASLVEEAESADGDPAAATEQTDDAASSDDRPPGQAAPGPEDADDADRRAEVTDEDDANDGDGEDGPDGTGGADDAEPASESGDGDSAGDEEEKETSGGFFSRLFGRG